MKVRLDTLYGPLVKLGVGVVVLLWIGVMTTMVVALVRDMGNGAPVAPSKDLVTPLIAVTGVLVAVLAFVRDRQKIQRDMAEAKSKVLYEQAKGGLDAAYELLKDLNNDRIIWIRAARVLASALHLGKQIESGQYVEAYRLAEDAVRARLYDGFMEKNHNGERVAPRAAFFFGHPDWRTFDGDLKAAALATFPQGRVFSVQQHESVPEMIVRPLSADSVIVIMGFLQFPPGYPDSLDGVEPDAYKAWPDTYGPLQGAARYLSFLDRYRVVNGEVREKMKRKANP